MGRSLLHMASSRSRALAGSGASRETRSTGTVRGVSHRTMDPTTRVQIGSKGKHARSKLVALLLQSLEEGFHPSQVHQARFLDHDILRHTAHHDLGKYIAPG